MADNLIATQQTSLNLGGAIHLADRNPSVSSEALVSNLVPPPRFAEVSFESYVPDPGQPSQAEAVQKLVSFADNTNKPSGKKLFGLFGKKSPQLRAGIYLDGGFGVGKTHLLASLWHRVEGRKSFGTFVEYTNLVGALGFRQTVDYLSHNKLVCIDEFELDDPGDTVLMSRLMRELADAGVRLAATSNTLPGALGEGRFAAQDFLREIQVLANQFDVHRIDGEDYRHRGLPSAPNPLSTAELEEASTELTAHGKTIAIDDFSALAEHLAVVHPSKYRALIDGVDIAIWKDVKTIENEATALRMVVLADRFYDKDLPIINSGVPFDKLFTDQMMQGGYKKKYFRAVSRLTALARQGQELLGN